MSLPTLDSGWFSAIAPVSINAGAATPVDIDTAGYDFMEVIVHLGVTASAATVCRITESATAGGSFTAVSGMTFGTSTSPGGSTSTLPSATNDGGLFIFTVDLRKQAFRWKNVEVTADTGAMLVCAVARLSKADSSPTTGLELGAVLNTAWLDNA